MNLNNIILGIDIGGTSIKSGLVDIKSGDIIDKVISYKTPNPASVNNILDVMQSIKRHYNWNGKVGCGFPGVIKEGKIFTAANLSKSWIGQDLKSQLESIFTNDIAVLNDADAAGIAEILFGSGKSWNEKKYETILIITLGTGIGSSLFIKGQLVPNTEFGHIIMDGMPAEKIAATVIKENENLTWQQWGERVNKYLQVMCRLLSPDCVIIGGGISENPKLFFQYIDINCSLLPAKTGSEAGIIGAALSLKK